MAPGSPPKIIPAEARERIKKIFPLMSSDNAGECAAAAAAIMKILKANNCDWHDLTAALVTPAAAPRQDSFFRQSYYNPRPRPQPEYRPPPPPPPPPKPPPPPPPPKPEPDGGLTLDAADVIIAVDRRLESGVWLSDNARNFLEQSRSRARYSKKIVFSEKQASWFRDLLAAAGLL